MAGNYPRMYPELTVDGEFKKHTDEGFDGALNDKIFSRLRSLGYEGSISDMLYAYHTNPLVNLQPRIYVNNLGVAWATPSNKLYSVKGN